MSRLATIAANVRRVGRSHRIGRIFSIGLMIVVGALLLLLARRIDWREVGTALTDFRFSTLLLAFAAMCVSYAIYSTYDLIGRHTTGHHLATRKVMTIGLISYAFNQSLTAWVGGIAVRYRLYARHDIAKGTIAQIFALSIITNWLGHLTLSAAVLLGGVLPVPAEWPVGVTALRWIGVPVLALPLGYLYLCHRHSGREFKLFGHEWSPPGLRTAALQIVLGSANWAAMATVIYILLRQQIDYPVVLSILLTSAVGAVILHIPAGLGVVEGLFITLLRDQMPRSSVMAAMIAYRAIYFLLPLLPAAAVYFAAEMRSRRGAKTAVDGSRS